MKIAFNKINEKPYKFSLNIDDITFSGELSLAKRNLVKVNGLMRGEILRNCDRCGDEIKLEINEKIDLLLSNGAYKDNKHELSDVMEFFGGEIDLNELALSELGLYLSDYFYCQKCQN